MNDDWAQVMQIIYIYTLKIIIIDYKSINTISKQYTFDQCSVQTITKFIFNARLVIWLHWCISVLKTSILNVSATGPPHKHRLKSKQSPQQQQPACRNTAVVAWDVRYTSSTQLNCLWSMFLASFCSGGTISPVRLRWHVVW